MKKDNEKGLHGSFYSDYYPIDTSKVVEVVPETPPQALTVSIYDGPYQRRLPTPIRTVLYTFRYEYFEE
jgi:hypothetical protein